MYPRYKKALDRIANGDLTNYQLVWNGKGRLLILNFQREAMSVPERFIVLFDEALRSWNDRAVYKPKRPPAEFRDCVCYNAEQGYCRALTEMLCLTKGKCSFYKGRENK